MANESDYPEWQAATERITGSGGLALVIGPPDTGKTTFCRVLALQALAQGRSVAIVDADTGQSELGPPSCVSVAVLQAPFERLSDLQPDMTAFVGSVSPRYGTIEHLAAVCRAVGYARSRHPDLIVCDTTGYVRGLTAKRLKRAKIEALQPEHVVRLSRRPPATGSEAPPKRPEIHDLPVPAAIVPKPPPLRARRREARFERVFAASVVRAWALDSVQLHGTWLGSGKPLMAAALAQLSRRLRAATRYGEVSSGHLGIVVGAMPRRDAVEQAARELYGAADVSVTHEANLDQLLVGLHDGEGAFVGLGRITAVDWAGRALHIATATHSHAIVRSIHFGLVRVNASGQTLGVLWPGDV